MELPISTMALLTPKPRVTGKSMPQGAGWGAGAERALTQASSPVWCMLVFFRYITIFCKPFCGRGWKMRISILQFCLWPVGYYMHIWREKPGETDYEELAHTGVKAEKHHDAVIWLRRARELREPMMWIPVWGQEKMTWDDPAHQRRGSSFFRLVTVNP